MKSAVLALAAVASGMAPAHAQTLLNSPEDYPLWVTVPTGAAEETVVLKHPDHLTLFNLRPAEAFALLGSAEEKRGRELLPADTHLIRVPGAQMVACQAIRPKGNERFTCLRDADANGTFDEYFRPGAQSNLFILPLQQFQPEFEPLSAAVGYRAIDESAESATSKFIMQYAVQGKLIIINFCFEPYRRVSSWGYPHLVDDCLVKSLSHRRGREYPYATSLLGVEIEVLSYDQATKETTFRVRRKAEEFPITFGFEYK